MKCEKHLKGFTEYLTVNHYSERTVESYALHTRQFLEFLTEHYPRITSVEKIVSLR